jgi:hypothetical protein
MHYKVTARFRAETAAQLQHKLDTGEIARQKPDGQEIVASLERAVVTEDGRMQWSEMCFCPTPLAHERATVLDHHFEDISTTEIEHVEPYEGQPFLSYLAKLLA